MKKLRILHPYYYIIISIETFKLYEMLFKLSTRYVQNLLY